VYVYVYRVNPRSGLTTFALPLRPGQRCLRRHRWRATARCCALTRKHTLLYRKHKHTFLYRAQKQRNKALEESAHYLFFASQAREEVLEAAQVAGDRAVLRWAAGRWGQSYLIAWACQPQQKVYFTTKRGWRGDNTYIYM